MFHQSDKKWRPEGGGLIQKSLARKEKTVTNRMVAVARKVGKATRMMSNTSSLQTEPSEIPCKTYRLYMVGPCLTSLGLSSCGSEVMTLDQNLNVLPAPVSSDSLSAISAIALQACWTTATGWGRALKQGPSRIANSW